MNPAVKSLICKVPFVQRLRKRLGGQGAYPAGHYHSPIPSEEDVRACFATGTEPTNELPGIDLNAKGQWEALVEYARFYSDLPFTAKQTPEHRYYYDNEWFSYSDAIFLFCFLRKQMPKRIVEVGSGFSSAVMLDTVDGFFPHRPEMTFIEPHPERLLSMLRETDRAHVQIIDRRVQEVPLEDILALESGDFLFIDSSHVVKCGSDLQLLLFEILPRLRPGVFVHFHDIFYPFEYPSEWLTKEGRFWNENYFMRAFLSYNDEWRIHFFNTYAHRLFGDSIKEKMPLCVQDHGGGLYLQRRIDPLAVQTSGRSAGVPPSSPGLNP